MKIIYKILAFIIVLIIIGGMSVKTAKAQDSISVYMVGDSLVQTYKEDFRPQAGWGQMLPDFFEEDVTFINKAIGGRSTGNFLSQGRLDEVLKDLKKGDYVLIQFGHNDATVNNEDRYVSVPDYKVNLAQHFIKPIREKGAIPILITLVNRNDYNETSGEFNQSFKEYVNAMKEVAKETDTLIVDLNKLSIDFCNEVNKTYGKGATDDLIYLHAEAGIFSGNHIAGVTDNTHLNEYGAKMIARLLALELKEMKLVGFSEKYKPINEENNLPEKVKNIIQIKSLTYGNRIKWEKPENALYYEIYSAEHKEGELVTEFKLTGITYTEDYTHKNSAILKNYAYKVIAVNVLGKSDESEIFLHTKESIDKKEKVTYDFTKVVNEEKKDSILNIRNVIILAGCLIVLVGVIFYKKGSIKKFFGNN